MRPRNQVDAPTQPHHTSKELSISEYEELLAAHPDDPVILNNLGALYINNERVRDGLELIKKAADAQPSIWDFQLNTSIAYMMTKQLDPALTYALRAQKADPEQYNVRHELCEIYLEKRMPEALKCFKDMAGDKRSEPMDLLGYGEALALADDLPRAMDILSTVVNSLPGSGLAQNELGVIAFKLRRYADAVKSMREAVRLDPDNAKFRFNLGIAQMANHDRAGAISEYSMLKTTDPTLADQLYRAMFAGKVVQAPH